MSESGDPPEEWYEQEGESSSKSEDTQSRTGEHSVTDCGEPPKPDAWIHSSGDIAKDPKGKEYPAWSKLYSGQTTQSWVLGLLSEVTEKATNFINHTVNKQISGSIEEQEKAIELIQSGETEEAVDVLADNIGHMLEQKDLFRIHMEDVADEQVEKTREVFSEQ